MTAPTPGRQQLIGDLMRGEFDHMSGRQIRLMIEEAEPGDLDQLGLSVKTYRMLRNAGFGCVSELFERGDDLESLLKIRNFGPTNLAELRRRLLKWHREHLAA